MNTAILIKADGTEQEVVPRNGTDFSLEEMQSFVGGLVEITPLPSGKILISNEEGKLDVLPINLKAIEIWKREYPIEKYPHNNDELVVGDVIIADQSLVS